MGNRRDTSLNRTGGDQHGSCEHVTRIAGPRSPTLHLDTDTDLVNLVFKYR
jgi:hypothetical protein